MKLWYEQPAKIWEEALPVGNGRLGGMVFGDCYEEKIQLNEDTLWSGYPLDKNNYTANKYLEEVRELLFDNKYLEAHQIIHKKMLGPWNESYQPMGDLNIKFDHKAKAKNYRRELDIEKALTTTKYDIEGVDFVHEVFSSKPDDLLVVHIYSSKSGMINLEVSIDSLLKHHTISQDEDTLILNGICPDHVEPSYVKSENPVIYEDDKHSQSMKFQIYLKSIIEGGQQLVDNEKLVIHGTDSVTLLLSGMTSFNGFNKNPRNEGKDFEKLNRVKIEEASTKKYKDIKNDHIIDYNNLFNRVEIYLGENEMVNIPTDERLRIAKNGVDDPQLIALLFQFGRYLLISCSRPNTQPANLQGIWNDHIRAPWSSNWTTNINAQMNYWLAEVCNLSECHEPLFDLIQEVSENGSKTADVHYGCRGWTVHHNVDIWRQSTPVGHFDKAFCTVSYSFWPMAGAWFCRHLWEHFLFTQNMNFLKNRAYPLMKGAALFCLDWLIEDKDGHLVTNPSTSPENNFLYEGKKYSASVSSTMDMAILRDLFSNCIEACKVLDMDQEFSDSINIAIKKLLPYKIGRFGQLQEWYQDFDEYEKEHRHVSHLYALYPAHSINLKDTPELAQACKVSLKRRGDVGTGWSLAWKVNLWARLGEGDKALGFIKRMLNLVTSTEIDYVNQGGIYPNLFDAHPPFQIDGNFGVTAGIAEMLIQSHGGQIILLPALPQEWKDGYVKGLRARGGLEIDIEWKEGKLIKARIKSLKDQECELVYSNKVFKVEISSSKSIEVNKDSFM